MVKWWDDISKVLEKRNEGNMGREKCLLLWYGDKNYGAISYRAVTNILQSRKPFVRVNCAIKEKKNTFNVYTLHGFRG